MKFRVPRAAWRCHDAATESSRFSKVLFGIPGLLFWLFSPLLCQAQENAASATSATAPPPARAETAEAEAGQAEPSSLTDVSVKMTTGGINRYVANRWGLVSATVFNRGDKESSGLVVVTPQSSGGVQFARKVAVPAKTAFTTSWPVRIDNVKASGLMDLEYLYFPQGEEDGIIRRRSSESALPSISGMVSSTPGGLCGLILDSEDPGRMSRLPPFVRAMRFNKYSDLLVVSILSGDIGRQRECLDAIDQLTVGDSHLTSFPEACDSIRAWVCRGGRLLIAMDETGPEVAQLLLGGSLPFSVVGESSTLSVNLQINSDYPENQFPVRSVTRDYDEPVRFLRIVAEAGEPIWKVDGWPVAIRVPMGLGTVVLTTIQSDVFIEPRAMAENKPESAYGMIQSSRRMLDSLYNPRVPSLLSEEAAGQHAATLVGYQVPGRTTAGILLVLFPIVLIAVGTLLQRKESGQRLIWALPALAVLTAVPAVVIGMQMRAVAPTTVVETSLIASTPGETQLVGDGFASVYVPTPTDLNVQSSTGSVLEVQAEATNQDYKRLVWDNPETSHWENLQQHVGLKTRALRFEKTIPEPIQAVATFDARGVRGQLKTSGIEITSPLLLASENADQMSLEFADGEFHGGSAEMLATGQYSRSAIVSEESRYQTALLSTVFNQPDRQETFPPKPTLIFWVDPNNDGLTIGGENARRSQAALLLQPLQLVPPEAGTLISIPPPFLPYRSVATDSGSYSSVFNNGARRWNSSESATTTRLEFEIPGVCYPFEIASAEVSLVIRAASRKVIFRWKGDDEFQDVVTMTSPLGATVVAIPPELLSRNISEKLYLEFEVGEIGSDRETSGDTLDLGGEQDDSWQVERLMLSVTGRRTPPAVVAK